MRILVVCQHYYPEQFRITDICEELVRRGHEVTVLTGLPNYPMGKIFDGYRRGKKRDEVINGVKVHRCFTIGRRRGVFFRVLNYYSFAVSSTHYAKKLKEQFDVVFVNQLSPIMMARAGVTYKKKHHVPLVMYTMDLWPESLVAGGIKRGSLAYRHYHKVSEKIYKQADKILITSASFADYFEKEFGIRGAEYLPQYAEALFNPEECRREADGRVNLMFAGNIGAMQSVQTILEAAKLTRDIENLTWHIVGDGVEYEKVKTLAEGMDNVVIHGRKPLEEMPNYYRMADAMLVTMKKDPIISYTLPGKVQTYLAAGKPIIGAIDGEAQRVIRDAECGYCADAEAAEGLAECTRRFVESQEKGDMAENAARYYNEKFSERHFFEMLEKSLGEIVGEIPDDQQRLRDREHGAYLH